MHSSPADAARTVRSMSESPDSGGGPSPNRQIIIPHTVPSPWPINPTDVTPLQWGRTMQADHPGDAQPLLLLSRTETADLPTIAPHPVDHHTAIYAGDFS